MIVVDSNVLAYLCLPGEFTTAAETLMECGPDWNAPVLYRSEFRNILAGYLRRGQLTIGQAHVLQSEAEDLLRDGEYEVDSRSVLDMVRDSECSAYDCEFVTLAMRLGTRLVTMDDKVLRSFPDISVPLTT